MIQITVFLEILTSCFLGSEVVGLGEWTSQTSRTPLNRNPSGWRTDGKFAGLAIGMPDVPSTGLEGDRSCSRAERSADLGLDDEMLRAKDSSLIASEEPPGLEDRRARLSHLQASSSFSGQPGRRGSMRRRRPDDHVSSAGLPRTVGPAALTRHMHENGSPFPPEVILGGFLLVASNGRRRADQVRAGPTPRRLDQENPPITTRPTWT